MDGLTKTTGAGQPEDTKTVREIVELQSITLKIKQDILSRLDTGEHKYGHKLKMNWPKAKQELYQELLDAYVYALSAGLFDVAEKIIDLITILFLGEEDA